LLFPIAQGNFFNPQTYFRSNDSVKFKGFFLNFTALSIRITLNNSANTFFCQRKAYPLAE